MKKLTIYLMAIAFSLVSQFASSQEKPSPVLLGGTFHDFKLMSHEGKEVALSNLKNKKVMLVFPRGKVRDDYWCSICMYQYAELAKMEIDKKFKEKYNIEVLFILPYNKDTIKKWVEYLPKGVATVEKWKNPENPNDEGQKNWAKVIKNTCPRTIIYKDGKAPFPFPILIDSDHALSSKLDIFRAKGKEFDADQNNPTIFIIDEKGVVQFKYVSQNTFDRPKDTYLLKFIEKMM